MDEIRVRAPAGSSWERLAGQMDKQSWPEGALYVVATPIGNLGDLGLRAWWALRVCDVIAAEDTRSSRVLLQAWDIDTPLMAAHRHNEASAAAAIVARLARGERVALVSDAGCPAVSDPGARVVRAAREAGHRVIPIPGASAVTTALMASGATSDENPAYAFAGFVPAKAGARLAWLRRWCALPAPVVMYESPHRLQATLAALPGVCGPERPLTVARELTKRFEQVVTLPAGEAAVWLASDPRHGQGEFVLIVHEDAQAPDVDAGLDDAQRLLLDELLGVLSVRDASRVVAKVTGLPRREVYEVALRRAGPAEG